MNKGKRFTRVCLDCGRVMHNVAGNLRFCAACRREHHNQYCRDYRARNEAPASVMWYTVWDAKTGDLLASGTSELCARRLGYKNANSFASAVGHGINGRWRHKCKSTPLSVSASTAARWTACHRYATNAKSLPALEHRRAQRVMSFVSHHHQNNTKQEVFQWRL